MAGGEKTKKRIEWLSENRNRILGTALFALFPLLCVCLWSVKEGHWISGVYLPASYWNDELFYYKQVEAMVSHGLPQGYFGFQEAHALRFTFAAWSPVILLPWVVWGLFFGWSLTAPIFANLVYSMLSMAVFFLLARPNRRQSIGVLVLLSLFTPYTRYILSGMPESIFIGLMLVFVGLSVSLLRRTTIGGLAAAFLLTGAMTLARPYLALLMLFPAFLCVRRYRFRGGVIGVCVLAVTMAGYAWISGNCCAPYLSPIVETEWLSTALREGIGPGITAVCARIADRVNILVTDHFPRAVRYGLMQGVLFATAGFLGFLLFLHCFAACKKRAEDRLFVSYVHCVGSIVGMILAVFLFYKLGEGSKHLLGFIVMALVLIALSDGRGATVMKVLAGGVCIWFFLVKALAPYDWQVPYGEDVLRAEAADLKAQADETLKLEEDTADPYDNTVIWLASDYVGEESIPQMWGLLYMLPEGFGINFCTQEYVVTHLDALQSRYIAAMPGGVVEAQLQERGCNELARTDHIAVFALR